MSSPAEPKYCQLNPVKESLVLFAVAALESDCRSELVLATVDEIVKQFHFHFINSSILLSKSVKRIHLILLLMYSILVDIAKRSVLLC